MPPSAPLARLPRRRTVRAAPAFALNLSITASRRNPTIVACAEAGCDKVNYCRSKFPAVFSGNVLNRSTLFTVSGRCTITQLQQKLLNNNIVIL